MAKIYVASPLGFSETGRLFLYEKIVPIIEKLGYKPIIPWELTEKQGIIKVKSMPPGKRKLKARVQLNNVIGMNNEKAIEAADGLVAVLDGTDVDSGTASEIGYGSALGKWVVGYRSDSRLSADNEALVVNLQVEYFIRRNGGTIARNLDELEKELAQRFGQL